MYYVDKLLYYIRVPKMLLQIIRDLQIMAVSCVVFSILIFCEIFETVADIFSKYD